MLQIRPTALRDILEDAIAAGVTAGYRRAYKHNDSPSFEAITDAIVASVMLNLDEMFEIGNEG
jgi:hypothetical protein